MDLKKKKELKTVGGCGYKSLQWAILWPDFQKISIIWFFVWIEIVNVNCPTGQINSNLCIFTIEIHLQILNNSTSPSA